MIDLKSKAGCVTIDTQLVKTIEKVEMFVPTAFTPNGDGLNDILRPVLLGVKKLHYFKIFNQWGQQIFESNSVKQGWNGMYKGVAQSAQVVVWIVEGMGVDNKIYQKKGSTTLLR
jgi:gliding motility-associated-like protein